MQNRGKTVFGRRDSKHILILANGDDVRHMVIRPWMIAIAASFVGVMAIGYLLATTYLVVRDDLIGSSMARQARLQHAYEDRIAQLRSELDRVTSRQLLNQQLVQDKLAELMQRQAVLSSRHGQLSPVLNRAGISDGLPTDVPVPITRSKDQASNEYNHNGNLETYKSAFLGADIADQNEAHSAFSKLVTQSDNLSIHHADMLFGNIALSLENIEQEQINRIQRLALSTSRRTAEIREILQGHKLIAPGSMTEEANSAIGGPFHPAEGHKAFNYSLRGLDEALQEYDSVLTFIDNLPIKYPVAGAKVSSRFGNRRDPFLGRQAFHAGIDFKARHGTSVNAVAKGKVVSAGWKGGYGKMVEIDHGNGTTTRYAHLSSILVRVGQYVDSNSRIGRIGSTGRSTGPHLHYEIRKNGKAVNPSLYLNAGLKLSPLLKAI